jgi:hypothetical protein
LIISPYFPPSNGADTQRVRMSLGYFGQNGWSAEVITVDPAYSEMQQDLLLLESLPPAAVIRQIPAFSKNWTGKFGLGSLGLRALWHYRQAGDRILAAGGFDLIYFSTTQFAVCALGPRWKKKFGVPFVIDMQDPWHSEYYRGRPRSERPPKYWFSYRLNKYLEAYAMRSVGGLVSVSPAYVDELCSRYSRLGAVPAAVIPFGAFGQDLHIATAHAEEFRKMLDAGTRSLVCIGRGGKDMEPALAVLFGALQKLVAGNAVLRSGIRLYFFGTSYAPAGTGRPSVLPVAQQFGVADMVEETTDRISYYHTLLTLQQADALFIPGSDDPRYTASKIYPYLLTGKPLLAVVHPASPARPVLAEYGVEHLVCFGEGGPAGQVEQFLQHLAGGSLKAPVYAAEAIGKYSAAEMTARQCALFERVLAGDKAQEGGRR